MDMTPYSRPFSGSTLSLSKTTSVDTDPLLTEGERHFIKLKTTSPMFLPTLTYSQGNL